MDWFKKYHPALHKKFGRNICLPCSKDGGIGVSPMFKISQHDQERVFKVANSYYEETSVEMFDTVEFVYRSGTKKDIQGENTILKDITGCLKPIINEINMHEGKLKITFIKPGSHTYEVENVPDDLIEKAKELAMLFEDVYQPVTGNKISELQAIES
ncbi:hypothetical protein CAP36_11370 [Chitinophagaceae bacterium IBVUCB2]|nr:hypothetical protein CAP36_11370 [Chitinophagaceae bacterium IBVUCB2]